MLYGKRSDGAYVRYEGMSPETVIGMLAAQDLSITWVSADEYLAATQN